MEDTSSKEFIDSFNEIVSNGTLLNWESWTTIFLSSKEAAKLACCVDPITWTDDKYAERDVPARYREKITRLERQLASLSSQWTLAKLAEFLGGEAPTGMIDAVMARFITENAKELECGTLDSLFNGKIIDWNYWASLANITPEQGAKLFYRIDPNRWPTNKTYEGELFGDSKRNIQKLQQLLEGYSNLWSLSGLVTFLGKHEELFGKVPFGMADAALKNQRIHALQEYAKELGKYLTHFEIAELWATSETERGAVKDYEARISKAVCDGELIAEISIRNPNTVGGFEVIQYSPTILRQAKDGWLNGGYLQFTIQRDNFQTWFDKSKQLPLADDCLLLEWFDLELKAKVGANDKHTTLGEREYTSWLRETWIDEGKQSGAPFFTNLKNHKGKEGSIVIDWWNVSINGQGVKLKTNTGEIDLPRKQVQKIVSKFRLEDKKAKSLSSDD
jgi:hypothetical protein